ncbi:MAG: flagellin lysine-N-methylase [Clostridia bacterium]|nr:flagellin lysine-N-methylase [Clostridia bacterium]
MKEYVLNYYQQFNCISERCTHTCCRGWDMCIDEKTLQEYKNCDSPFAPTLKKGVNFKKACFKKDKNGRCAFLNQKGLCEIIINLGENSLCQICRDHPRFKSCFEDRVETGLGFACEEATRVILSFKEKIQPVLLSDTLCENELSFVQYKLLEFRQQALDIIQDRNINIGGRIKRLLKLCNAQITPFDYKKIIKRFITLERLEKGWTNRLKDLKTDLYPDICEDLALYCEQFLANGLYRFICQAEDVFYGRAIAIACVFSWWLINSIYQNESKNGNTFETLCDIVRAYSAEVEYSLKNQNKLFTFAANFIKIER